MSVEAIKQEVLDFHTSHSVGYRPEDAFCGWWLRRRWAVEPLVAAARAPGGSDDFGLDGFHIETFVTGEPPVLHLIQAKYSESANMVRKGVKDLTRAVEPLSALLNGDDLPPTKTNPVLDRLHAALRQLRDEKGIALDQVRLRFEILHLVPGGSDAAEKVVSTTRENFDELCEDLLPGFERSLRSIYPPEEMPREDVTPARQVFPIRFAGEMVSDSERVRFFAGFGYLADLVQLYEQLGEPLFSKNVRSYLYRAHEKGPARYMRDSLRRACVPRNGRPLESPERFAMLHNGVALSAAHVEKVNGDLRLRDPAILNGCQTVKNAAIWIKERRNRANLDESAWANIRIPIRVLVTRDSELVRDVTVSNNRQNAIRPAAFRANDAIQLELAERFRRELKIYYERQEAAFQNLKKSNPRFAEEEFGSSFEKPLRMEDVAVAIACASLRPALSVASKMSDLFDDPVYESIFHEEKLQSLTLLVFLRNLLSVLPLVLRDIKKNDSAFDSISQGKFAYPCLRVLSRYIVRKHPELVDEYGRRVFASFATDTGLRRDIRALMRPANSGLQQLLKEHWFNPEDRKWKSATDAEAADRTLRSLRLVDFDVFAVSLERGI